MEGALDQVFHDFSKEFRLLLSWGDAELDCELRGESVGDAVAIVLFHAKLQLPFKLLPFWRRGVKRE